MYVCVWIVFKLTQNQKAFSLILPTTTEKNIQETRKIKVYEICRM